MRENERQRETARESEREVNLPNAKEWQVVKGRKTERVQKRADVARNYNYYAKEDPRTTFFFTNFPENFYAKHMLKAFLKYGEFEEVVIPAKRDIRGRRFGFARAVGVKNPERFVVRLDNIIIGSDKLMVNFPRFERNDGSLSKHGNGALYPQPAPGKPHVVATNTYRPKLETITNNYLKNAFNQEHQTQTLEPKTNLDPHTQRPTNSHPHNQASRQNNSTQLRPKHNHDTPKHPHMYEDGNNRDLVCLRPEYRPHSNYSPPTRPKKQCAHRDYNVEEQEMEKYSKAYVGVVRNQGMSYNIQEEFIQQGYFSVRATALGSNLVLLESLEEGEMEALLQDAKDWLGTWFSDVQK